MAVDALADILAQFPHVIDDGARFVVEDGVGAELAEEGVVLRGGERDDKGGGVEEARLLDRVHAHVRGG